MVCMYLLHIIVTISLVGHCSVSGNLVKMGFDLEANSQISCTEE